jgi:3-hydroxyacyl-[acyl-carrier-protein] dehydratase
LKREPGVAAECETQFEPNEPMFAGHFPGNPLVPGVILTEALAQTAGIAAADERSTSSKPMFLLSAIRQMKFLAAARPNDRIILRAKKTGEMEGLLQFDVEAIVDQTTIARGQIVLSTAE